MSPNGIMAGADLAVAWVSSDGKNFLEVSFNFFAIFHYQQRFLFTNYFYKIKCQGCDTYFGTHAGII